MVVVRLFSVISMLDLIAMSFGRVLLRNYKQPFTLYIKYDVSEAGRDAQMNWG